MNIYEENQFFRQWFIWVPLIIFAVCLGGYLGRKGYLFMTVENQSPIVGLAMILGGLVPFAIMALLYFSGLHVRVADGSLEYKFTPFTSLTTIPLSKIESAEVIEFSPMKDFGGWGVRVGKLGRALIISGNRGVKVSIDGGEVIILGSKTPEELATAINQTN